MWYKYRDGGQVANMLPGLATHKINILLLDHVVNGSIDLRPQGVNDMQGTVLGPLMFLLYINDISENISSTIRLFADDCIVHRQIINSDDTDMLQKDLDEISNWACKWQLKFNVSKCVLLRVTRNHSQFTNSYILNNQTIQLSDTYRYLGVTLNSTLTWNIHITNVTNQATKTLNFIKRNLGKCTNQIKSKAYMSLIRPILEYATQVSDPYQKTLIHKIEMIQ